MRIVTLVLCLLLPALVHAATSQVSPPGSLAAALSRLQPGDTLEVTGTFPEQLHGLQGTIWPSGTADKPITIQGLAGARIAPQVSADTFDALYITGSYLILDGLTIDGSGIRAQRGGWLVKLAPTAHHITIQNSTLTGYTQVACTGGWLAGCSQGGGIESGGSTDNVFRNNRLSDLTAYGLYVSQSRNLVEGNRFERIAGYGVHAYDSGQTSTVNDNIIRKNQFVHTGWNNTNPAGSCALVVASGHRNTVCGNDITGHNGCGVQVYSTAGETRVFGNSISGTVGPAIQNDGRGTMLDAPASMAAGGGDACGGLPFRGTPAKPPRPAPTHLRALSRAAARLTCLVAYRAFVVHRPS